jgi:hypothetical protein
MKHITREEWIEALESGKYQQASGVLMSHKGDGFCCIGVACDLAGVPRDELKGRSISHFDFLCSAKPGQLFVDLGLTARQCFQLAQANDRGHSFINIADRIRCIEFHKDVDKKGRVQGEYQ